MGYELDQLTKQYGIADPAIGFAGDPGSTSDVAAFNNYKNEQQTRLRETPQYLNAQYGQNAARTPPPNATANQLQNTAANYFNNTGNYWGNTLQAPVSTPTSNVDQISGWYGKVLGRAPDASGLTYWQDYARQHGMAAAEQQFNTSAKTELENRQQDTSGTAATIGSWYNRTLGRTPDAGGLAFYQDLIAKQGLAVAKASFDAAAKLELTPGLTPATTPGLTPATTPGLTPATTPGLTPATTPGLTSSTKTSTISDWYRSALGRDPDPDGLAFWSSAIDKQGLAGAWTGFIESAKKELAVKTPAPPPVRTPAPVDPVGPPPPVRTPTDVYTLPEYGQVSTISSWYRDVLGREPDPSGLAFWKNILETQGLGAAWLGFNDGAKMELAARTPPPVDPVGPPLPVGTPTPVDPVGPPLPAWMQYLDQNADLRPAGIDTEAEAMQHWNTYGQVEGRNSAGLAPTWQGYVGRYADLQQAGIDTEEEARTHWNTFGRNEGRQGFADGGAVHGRGLDLSRVSPAQLKMMQAEDPMALQRGVARFAGQGAPEQPVPVESNMGELQAMLANYQKPSEYAGQYEAAREAQGEQSKAFYDMINKMATESEAPPDKSEMYFRLAAAFGAPTKTGHFSESLGNVNAALADSAKENRLTARAQKQAKQQLLMQAQSNRMNDAQKEASDLRQLTGEEMRDSRAQQGAILKEYLASGKPQSDAGRTAKDEGLTPGTPEFNARVRQIVSDKLENGQYFKQATLALQQANVGIAQQGVDLRAAEAARKTEEAKKLNPTELKMKKDLEESLQMHEYMLTQYDKAYQLNPNTFDGSIPDRLQYNALAYAGSKDPLVVNTQEQENVLGSLSADNMKARFGAQFTEKEGELNRTLQGIGVKNKEAREKIIINNAAAVRNRLKMIRKQLADISSGAARTPVPQGE